MSRISALVHHPATRILFALQQYPAVSGNLFESKYNFQMIEIMRPLTFFLLWFILGFTSCKYLESDNETSYIQQGVDKERRVTTAEKLEDVLKTGFYFISDSVTGFERTLKGSYRVESIDPIPIVTVKDFDTSRTTIFQEKTCSGFIVWLNNNGCKQMERIRYNNLDKSVGFIISDSLISIRKLNDPQFATVDEDSDFRVYGEVLAIPCHTVSIDELKKYLEMVRLDKR